MDGKKDTNPMLKEEEMEQQQQTLAMCSLLAELPAVRFVFALFLPCSLSLVTDEWLHMLVELDPTLITQND